MIVARTLALKADQRERSFGTDSREARFALEVWSSCGKLLICNRDACAHETTSHVCCLLVETC